MVDLNTINNAGEIFTVFLKEVPTINIDESGVETTSFLGGVGYWSGLPIESIMPVTYQVVPLSRPFIMLLRIDIPFDYDINATFIATLDFNNPDGYGE